MLLVIGFQNRSAKIHSNARCGNGSVTYSSPVLIDADADSVDTCGRCGHVELPVATPETIAKAVAAYRHANRNVDADYAAKVEQSLLDRVTLAFNPLTIAQAAVEAAMSGLTDLQRLEVLDAIQDAADEKAVDLRCRVTEPGR